MASPDTDRKRIVLSLYISGLFAVLVGIVRLLESALNAEWYRYGIEPRTVSGLYGIVTAPFLHADWEHYASNAVALLVLGAVAIYAYRVIAYNVLVWVWFLDGIGVWLLGRDSFHIGASGLVYGLASFLMFSGVLRKNRAMLAISFFVIVGYGGMIWGMMPLLEHISWEAHLFGFLSGIGLAVYYRKQGPKDDPIPDWYYEEETDEADSTNPLLPPQPPASVDPLFPQAPDIAPREVPRQRTDDDESSDDEPRIRIRYNYRRNSE